MVRLLVAESRGRGGGGGRGEGSTVYARSGAGVSGAREFRKFPREPGTRLRGVMRWFTVFGAPCAEASVSSR